MQTERTLDLLRQYAELRESRVRQHGPKSVRRSEALESAQTAMELAGHSVSVEVPVAVHIAA